MRASKVRKIGKGQNLNIFNLGNTLIHVLIQKDTQNRLRFGRILAEEVFFLHLGWPVLCGSAAFAVCHIADEIEIVHIFHPLVCLQRFEVNAHRRERFLNGFLLVRRFPLADKIGQGSVFTLDIGSGVVDNILLLKQLAIRIIDRNGLIDNLYLAAVPVHDGRFHRIIGRILPTTAVTAALWLGAAMLKTLVLLNRDRPIQGR